MMKLIEIETEADLLRFIICFFIIFLFEGRRHLLKLQ